MAYLAVLIETPSKVDAIIPFIPKKPVNFVKTKPITHLNVLDKKSANLLNFITFVKFPIIVKTKIKINIGIQNEDTIFSIILDIISTIG